MPDAPPLALGRILVRVVLSEPAATNATPPFQRVYEPVTTLRTIAWSAWGHFAPHLPPDAPDAYYDAMLCRGPRILARIVESGGYAVSEVETAWVTTAGPIPHTPRTLGDYLDMDPGDQTTLGTVQFELRGVPLPQEMR